MGHGIIIEGNGIMIAAFQRIVLRPSSIGELGLQKIVNTAFQTGPDFFVRGSSEPPGQKAQLLRGGAVVQGAGVVIGLLLGSPRTTGRARRSVTDRLRPSAAGQLP